VGRIPRAVKAHASVFYEIISHLINCYNVIIIIFILSIVKSIPVNQRTCRCISELKSNKRHQSMITS